MKCSLRPFNTLTLIPLSSSSSSCDRSCRLPVAQLDGKVYKVSSSVNTAVRGPFATDILGLNTPLHLRRFNDRFDGSKFGRLLPAYTFGGVVVFVSGIGDDFGFMVGTVSGPATRVVVVVVVCVVIVKAAARNGGVKWKPGLPPRNDMMVRWRDFSVLLRFFFFLALRPLLQLML